MQSSEIYSIGSFKSENECIAAIIAFNEKHPLFAGHFPGNPIVPGVIQVQVIKNLMEKNFGQDLFLIQAKNIKFLSIISPVSHSVVEVAIRFQQAEDKSLLVKATLHSGEITFMKFDGIFKQAF
jgi:3-hydroxyacyl-[acyl-carrier-protein] dehydratase